ncbi:MAG: hypothetical protein ACRDQZ_14065 [Mycobacteriales bacterium]
MRDDDAVARLTAMSADQFGVFTVEQAAAVGVDLATLERLEQVERPWPSVDGIYELPNSGFEDDSAYGLWLSLDPATMARDRIAPQCGVMSHRSAANWLNQGDFLPDLVVTLPPDAPALHITDRTAKRIVVCRVPLPPQDWFMHNGVPVTTPARMVRDLLEIDDEPLPLEDETSVGRILLGIQKNGDLDLNSLAVELDDYARRENYGGGEYLVRLLNDAAQPGSGAR